MRRAEVETVFSERRDVIVDSCKCDKQYVCSLDFLEKNKYKNISKYGK
jgi:hypothetical protein